MLRRCGYTIFPSISLLTITIKIRRGPISKDNNNIKEERHKKLFRTIEKLLKEERAQGTYFLIMASVCGIDQKSGESCWKRNDLFFSLVCIRFSIL